MSHRMIADRGYRVIQVSSFGAKQDTTLPFCQETSLPESIVLLVSMPAPIHYPAAVELACHALGI